MTTNATVCVSIPGPFRASCAELTEIRLAPTSIPEILNALCAQFPPLRRQLLDDSGRVLRHVNIFLNEEDVRFLPSADLTLKAGDRVDLIPAISGG